MDHKIFTASDVILFIVVLTGLVTDLRWRRLPNWLTFPAMIVGIILQTVASGWRGTLDAIGGVLFAAVLLLPFYHGGLGAGDLKFVAAIGALKGWRFALWSTLYGAVLGGLVSVIILLRQRRLKEEFWRFFLMLQNLRQDKADRPDLRPEKKRESLFPYGVVLAIGVLIFRFFGS
ncbi:MAG TPA: prepilin peptidase [Firmicutes bacterium]|nr:prepilin peptidase [Bacillota bacterium]HOQ23112.1 A24 family peptidase [Bacillota bacterium]HPT67009.1 A24 family peptidase [Bacillota bacterium]